MLMETAQAFRLWMPTDLAKKERCLKAKHFHSRTRQVEQTQIRTVERSRMLWLRGSSVAAE